MDSVGSIKVNDITLHNKVAILRQNAPILCIKQIFQQQKKSDTRSHHLSAVYIHNHSRHLLNTSYYLRSRNNQSLNWGDWKLTLHTIYWILNVLLVAISTFRFSIQMSVSFCPIEMCMFKQIALHYICAPSFKTAAGVTKVRYDFRPCAALLSLTVYTQLSMWPKWLSN